MEYKDYYKILGVPKTASDKEIKAAYRRLARKHHPDVNPGNKQAEARFKEINEANEVLSDPGKRRRYDQMGENWSRFQNVGGTGPFGGSRVRVQTYPGGEFQGFSDFFKTFFGGGASDGDPFEDLFGAVERGRSEVTGGDVEREIELTLEEVLRGTERTLTTGDPRSGRRGQVKIPAGVREGSRVRVSGEGAAGIGGRRGDLFLRVRIAPHPVFERKGDDLLATITVPVTTAVLGGELQVPTLEGPKGIKVPAGTPVGRVFRLRGHGLPRLDLKGARGDLLATLSVELPRNLSRSERELFEELRRLGH